MLNEPGEVTRTSILKKANVTVSVDREASHGNPENSFDRIVKLWSAYLDIDLAAYDVALLMDLMKTARLNGNPFHLDSWIDKAGYSACGGEIALNIPLEGPVDERAEDDQCAA